MNTSWSILSSSAPPGEHLPKIPGMARVLERAAARCALKWAFGLAAALNASTSRTAQKWYRALSRGCWKIDWFWEISSNLCFASRRYELSSLLALTT